MKILLGVRILITKKLLPYPSEKSDAPMTVAKLEVFIADILN